MSGQGSCVLRWLASSRHSLPFNHLLLEINYSADLCSAVIKILVKDTELSSFLLLNNSMQIICLVLLVYTDLQTLDL